MNCDEFMDRHRASLARRSPFERIFVQKVLCRVAQMAASAHEPLDFSDVSIQTPFPTPTSPVSGTGQIDFTISEGAEVRIAIEVDGWDKTGNQQGETPEEFRNRSRRETEIQAQGWRVLRFANSHFDREPERVARCVWLSLRRDRELGRRLREALAQTADFQAQISRSSHTADDPRSAEKRFQDARQRAKEIESALYNVSHTLPEEIEEQFPRGELDELRRLSAESARENEELKARILQIEATEKAEWENKRVKVVPVSVAVIIVGVAMATYLVMRLGVPPPPAEPCAPPIAWSDASGCLGKSTTVQGVVAGVANGAGNGPDPTFINIGRPFPDGFAVVIFNKGILESLKVRGGVRRVGDNVCVEGTITEFEGRPQIKVESPSQLIGCDP